MSDKELVYHCFDINAALGGGVETYLETLINARPLGGSDQIISCLRGHDQSRYGLLHVHERHLLRQLSGECPTVK